MQRAFSYRVDLEEESKSQQPSENSSDDGLFFSELREVIVIFISVSLSNREVSVSSRYADYQNYQVGHDTDLDLTRAFHFLSRNAKELADDKATLQQFQDCFQVIAQEFQRDGGQVCCLKICLMTASLLPVYMML
jgi:hypothetical protein